jgi:hypothetical protein
MHIINFIYSFLIIFVIVNNLNKNKIHKSDTTKELFKTQLEC